MSREVIPIEFTKVSIREGAAPSAPQRTTGRGGD